MYVNIFPVFSYEGFPKNHIKKGDQKETSATGINAHILNLL